MSFSASQRAVLRGMGLGLVATVLVLGAGAWWFDTDSRRCLPWLVLLPLPLAVCIARIAQHRFFTREDIDGSGLTAGSERVKLLQAVLQNTLEQTVLALPSYAAAALLLPAAALGCVPAGVLLFVLGRALFIAGYAGGAGGRALGFALSFYPSLTMLLLSLLQGIRAVLLS